MFADLKEIKSEKDGKIIIYHEIQTSEGQSGAPIILKLQDLYQIIGVHTCYERGYNIGVLIESISYESFR